MEKLGSRRGLGSIFGSRTASETSSVAGKELVSVPDGPNAASLPAASPPRTRDLAPTFSTVEDSPMFRNKVPAGTATTWPNAAGGGYGHMSLAAQHNTILQLRTVVICAQSSLTCVQAKESAAASERLRTRTTKLVKGSTKCAHSCPRPALAASASFQLPALHDVVQQMEASMTTGAVTNANWAIRPLHLLQTGTASRSWRRRRPSSRTT